MCDKVHFERFISRMLSSCSIFTGWEIDGWKGRNLVAKSQFSKRRAFRVFRAPACHAERRGFESVSPTFRVDQFLDVRARYR